MALKVARVQDQGQVTIPAEIREKLGLEEGDWVAFVETEDGVMISPQPIEPGGALEQLKAQRVEESKQDAHAVLDAFVEKLRGGKAGDVPEISPEEAVRIVEATAGIFRREDVQEPDDFKQWRRRYEQEVAERVLNEMRENKG